MRDPALIHVEIESRSGKIRKRYLSFALAQQHFCSSKTENQLTILYGIASIGICFYLHFNGDRRSLFF